MTDESKVPLEVRRAASQTARALWDTVTRGDREIGPTMCALVAVFRSVWRLDGRGVEAKGRTPAEAFEALSALYDRGEMGVGDDPARGRYVHPEHPPVQ